MNQSLLLRLPILVSLALISIGCSQKTEPITGETKSQQNVLALQGPGGTVSIGDRLDAAKKAFPAPKDAEVFSSSMSFTIIAPDGWAWSVERSRTGFEAALKGEKIIGLAQTNLGPMPPKDREETAASQFGKPNAEAKGKTASILVWHSSEYARFMMLFRSKDSVFGPGEMTLIGKKEDLKLLGYSADEPGIMVKQMDASAEAMNGVNLKDEFAKAKERAKAKLK